MAGPDKSWLPLASLCLPLVATLTACSLPTRSTLPTPQPLLSPFADSAVSLLIHGHFVRGEQVVVRLCLHADHSIASSAIVESSGDWRFDEMALDWARHAQLRTQAAPGRAIARCGSVRVELHDTAAPGMGRSAGEQLG